MRTNLKWTPKNQHTVILPAPKLLPNVSKMMELMRCICICDTACSNITTERNTSKRYCAGSSKKIRFSGCNHESPYRHCSHGCTPKGESDSSERYASIKCYACFGSLCYAWNLGKYGFVSLFRIVLTYVCVGAHVRIHTRSVIQNSVTTPYTRAFSA